MYDDGQLDIAAKDTDSAADRSGDIDPTTDAATRRRIQGPHIAVKIVCVKHGTKYGDEWVINLRRMVSRHLPIPHEFVCITDKPVPDVECIPLDTNLAGWWAKLYLFKPGVLTPRQDWLIVFLPSGRIACLRPLRPVTPAVTA